MSPRRTSEEEREPFFSRIPARKQNLQQGTERFLGPRVAEGQHLQQSVLCWWRCVLGETKATNYPPSPSQGQGWWVWRETSCRSLDLGGGVHRRYFVPAALPEMCRVTLISFLARGRKKRNLCKTTSGSHGIALLSHLTCAQRLFYQKKRRKSWQQMRKLVFGIARFSSDCCRTDNQLPRPTSVASPVTSHAPKYLLCLCFVFKEYNHVLKRTHAWKRTHFTGTIKCIYWAC